MVHQARVVLLLLVVAFVAHADTFGDRSKWGLSLDRLQNANSGEYGVALGFKHDGYFNGSDVYAGYEIHAGSDRGQTLAKDNITYGGFNLGFDGNYFKTISYDFGLLVGYGFGSIARYNQNGESAVIQPNLSVGLIMVSGYRAAFGAGYLFMPAANNFSTWTFGVRLERKIGAEF